MSDFLKKCEISDGLSHFIFIYDLLHYIYMFTCVFSKRCFLHEGLQCPKELEDALLSHMTEGPSVEADLDRLLQLASQENLTLPQKYDALMLVPNYPRWASSSGMEP